LQGDIFLKPQNFLGPLGGFKTGLKFF